MSIVEMKKNTNTLNLRAKDPFLEREKHRYENPLPSREWIISVLEETGVPVKIPNLAEKLSITEAEYEFFERRIKAMARDGQVLINRREAVCASGTAVRERAPTRSTDTNSTTDTSSTHRHEQQRSPAP